ncbi:hypothetical protein AVEN_53833-1 [Araneus ventricosus]|uniref:Uncharacterized protein n=1 Tax=Araneus ventricosus TaxID=182803 RepID=A0A4Y2EZJ8_ARAVE|nr:hypothetical protein AVEN_53833-1 [Araneus ventricosus]
MVNLTASISIQNTKSPFRTEPICLTYSFNLLKEAIRFCLVKQGNFSKGEEDWQREKEVQRSVLQSGFSVLTTSKQPIRLVPPLCFWPRECQTAHTPPPGTKVGQTLTYIESSAGVDITNFSH